MDGVVELASGESRSHPARKHQRTIAVQLRELLSLALESGLHFNVTQISSPGGERSLTMEEVAVRFDIRYRIDEAALVAQFLDRWGASVKLKQHYVPFGKERCGMPTAPFSMALGNVLGSDVHVTVVPGGRADNGNHRPDEWVELPQVEPHQATLRDVLINEFGACG
ncbi:hypothetical protein D9M68_848430 [compost metagenome]